MKYVPDTPLDDAHKATLAAEERFRLLVDSVKDYGIFLIDPTGVIQSWNKGAERIKGYGADEIIGKHFSVFYTKEDVDRGHPAWELEEAMKVGKYEEEGWRVRKDGTRFWANIVITPLKDNHGTHVGFAKVTRDLTERKESEERLRQSNANLEKRVEERTRELREAVSIRDEFLSIASHELRTPLTPLKLNIQSLLRVIRKRFAGAEDERIQKIAESCDVSVTRLSNLIDNLLDVSRINNGKLNLNLEEVDLAQLIDEIIQRYKNEAISSGSEVHFVNPGSFQGTFDRLRIEQVVINLLTNALKYGDKKDITISISQDARDFIIQVRDQGQGIHPDHREKIFERFERVNDNGKIGGLGLGLYISRQIVAAHKGTIQVESSDATGSVFVVRLPKVVSP